MRRQINPAVADVAPVSGRILVLDGDQGTLVSVSGQLTTLGFDVVILESAASVLSRIASEFDHGSISGMLMELTIPLPRALAMLQIIRDRYPHIPVIAMSDAKNITGLRRAVELGAREYLVKPFDAELLKRKCLRIFRSVEQKT